SAVASARRVRRLAIAPAVLLFILASLVLVVDAAAAGRDQTRRRVEYPLSNQKRQSLPETIRSPVARLRRRAPFRCGSRPRPPRSARFRDPAPWAGRSTRRRGRTAR